MEIIRLKRKDKITNLMLDKQITIDKRVIQLFVPIKSKLEAPSVIHNSKIFGGVQLDS